MIPVRPVPEDSDLSDSESPYPKVPHAWPYQGVVNGGQSRAVAGAKVYVLQVNSSGYGNSSVSLLSSENPPDAIGHYVISGEYGGFSIAGHYTCSAGHQVYIYARGGNSGDDGSNSAIGLMALLGACPESGNFNAVAPFVFVNEVTTVVAAYALAPMAKDATHVVSSDADAAEISRASDFANIASGTAYATLPSSPRFQIPQAKIHTLANILSACVNSNTPASNGCAILFSNAPGASEPGAVPEETATAAINIASHPRANIAALFGLQPRLAAPFQPALASAPQDFELPSFRAEANNKVASLLADHR